NTSFPTLKVSDGDEIRLGNIELSFLETPGHTPEGITILAKDTENEDAPLKMFTGDTLFIGDVGRPDLVGSKGFTAEQMGEMLYDSLHQKILPLPDDTEVYPAHGAGSLCGKSLSEETWSTLGNQRQFNYALKPMSKEEFVQIVAADQPEVPMYFPKSAAKNLEGSVALEDLPEPGQMSTVEINNFDGIVLDVREKNEYGGGHVKGAINIGLAGQFASWAGTLISIGTPIAIAAETKDQVEEAFMRLARVGIETVKGYIIISDYEDELSPIEQVTALAVSRRLGADSQFVDVRRPQEHANGYASGALNIPLDRLAKEIDRLDPGKPTYVICQSGYRSSIGTSILENAGIKEIYNVAGGTNAWVEDGLDMDVSSAACANS
ncbi:MAG: rhodanese-like domain-containing protein, partial [Acidobacteriota bacterium]|nr:rhodanese-like domain-containing protein [Acidobacteriota bacterium]